MAKPYLTWTERGEPHARWLSDVLRACGHEEPLCSERLSSQTNLEQVKRRLEQADCFYGVLAANKSKGSPYPSRQPCHNFLSELRAALGLGLPVAVLVDYSLYIQGDVKEKAIWWPIDFSSPKALLAVTAAIIRSVCQTRSLAKNYALGEIKTDRFTFKYDPKGRLDYVLKSNGGIQRSMLTYLYDTGTRRNLTK